jgi:hypothetical protein
MIPARRHRDFLKVSDSPVLDEITHRWRKEYFVLERPLVFDEIECLDDT